MTEKNCLISLFARAGAKYNKGNRGKTAIDVVCTGVADAGEKHNSIFVGRYTGLAQQLLYQCGDDELTPLQRMDAYFWKKGGWHALLECVDDKKDGWQMQLNNAVNDLMANPKSFLNDRDPKCGPTLSILLRCAPQQTYKYSLLQTMADAGAELNPANTPNHQAPMEVICNKVQHMTDGIGVAYYTGLAWQLAGLCAKKVAVMNNASKFVEFERKNIMENEYWKRTGFPALLEHATDESAATTGWVSTLGRVFMQQSPQSKHVYLANMPWEALRGNTAVTWLLTKAPITTLRDGLLPLLAEYGASMKQESSSGKTPMQILKQQAVDAGNDLNAQRYASGNAMTVAQLLAKEGNGEWKQYCSFVQVVNSQTSPTFNWSQKSSGSDSESDYGSSDDYSESDDEDEDLSSNKQLRHAGCRQDCSPSCNEGDSEDAVQGALAQSTQIQLSGREKRAQKTSEGYTVGSEMREHWSPSW